MERKINSAIVSILVESAALPGQAFSKTEDMIS